MLLQNYLKVCPDFRLSPVMWAQLEFPWLEDSKCTHIKICYRTVFELWASKVSVKIKKGTSQKNSCHIRSGPLPDSYMQNFEL